MARLEVLRERFRSIQVVVLMGGLSGEREISLRSGRRVLEALRRQEVPAYPLDPAEAGWAEQLIRLRPDAVFLALHGRYGEDGTMQGFLETLGLRYTGSGVLASALAMDKVKTKAILRAEGLPTPDWRTVSPEEDLRLQAPALAEAIGFPMVIKPVAEGSSLGVSIVRHPDDLFPTLRKTFYEYRHLFVERYISGMEVTVGLLGCGDALRALPVLELVPKKEFYDYEAKYTPGMTRFYLPARLTPELTAHVQAVALAAHRALGCHGFSRVDMMISKDGSPYITEINTLPGLTDLSDLPAQAHAAGISYDELILEILESAFIERE
ncbi:MAG: D-alanine--D-alanine ligase [Candidatus Poribacteria bacterium]|nr:MAG: D-alanine--D-alanine ligase [Candidatus Poribacteria bacterium]